MSRRFKKVSVTVEMIYEEGNDNLTVWSAVSLEEHLLQVAAGEKIYIKADLKAESSMTIEEAATDLLLDGEDPEILLGIRKVISWE